MQSIRDIMGDRDFDQPPEVEHIKALVRNKFQTNVGVNVQATSITIVVNSASLAGSLRPYLYKLKKELETDKKIFIRIG